MQGWRRSQRVGIRVSQLRVEHLMASSAIPFAFPAQKINREFFGDGSIRQMAPCSPALHLGAERVFVIGTAKLVKDIPDRLRGDEYPSLVDVRRRNTAHAAGDQQQRGRPRRANPSPHAEILGHDALRRACARCCIHVINPYKIAMTTANPISQCDFAETTLRSASGSRINAG